MPSKRSTRSADVPTPKRPRLTRKKDLAQSPEQASLKVASPKKKASATTLTSFIKGDGRKFFSTKRGKDEPNENSAPSPADRKIEPSSFFGPPKPRPTRTTVAAAQTQSKYKPVDVDMTSSEDDSEDGVFQLKDADIKAAKAEEEDDDDLEEDEVPEDDGNGNGNEGAHEVSGDDDDVVDKAPPPTMRTRRSKPTNQVSTIIPAEPTPTAARRKPKAEAGSTAVAKKPTPAASYPYQAQRDAILAQFGGFVDVVPEKKPYQFWAKQSEGGPVAPGSKDLPTGAEDCLGGLTFVLTGELASMSRADAGDLVKRYGGRITSAPSSKTTFLIVGEDPGATKLEKAKKIKLKTLDEDGLLDLIRALPPGPDASSEPTVSQSSASPVIDEEPAQPPCAATAPDTTAIPASAGPVRTELWTDKYRPRSLKELCGNKSNVESIIRYLRTWRRALGHGGAPAASQTREKAVLVSGPPGIGKTTAVVLACESEGFQIIEMNASDSRNKKSLDKVVRELTGNRTVTEYFTSSNASPKAPSGMAKQAVLVMDEVDGMSAGDRGGMAELIQIIKKSLIPIICICNDRQSPNVRSLAGYCEDLRFRRPDANTIRSRLMTIAFKEKLKLQPNAIDQLVASTHADIRQILNLLSTYRLSNASMSYDDSKQYSRTAEKYITLNPFDVTGKLFSPQAYRVDSFATRLDYYFTDSGLIPLMVQENYINCEPSQTYLASSSAPNAIVARLDALSEAANAISEADLVDRVIGRSQQWGLMPVHAAFSCARPAFYMHGGMRGRYNFPGWLGKNSTATKFQRMLREIQIHMRLRISGDKHDVRQNYIPALVPTLTAPLRENGQAGIEPVMKVMDHYFLTKDDWDAVMEFQVGITAQSGPWADSLSSIPANVKSAFTRQYNKVSHPMAVPAPSSAAGGGGNGKRARDGASPISSVVPDSEGAVDVDEVKSEDDEDGSSSANADHGVDDDRLIKRKKTSGKGARTTAAASGSRKGRGRGRGKAKR
ncbi:DNA replication factor C complex subunit Rfc1 [Dimargaris verticillata]|uniref:Replication factor C subunit 1 n=1 Tax=Dimargaris verticillata TaxID=2761393 RepID=A0A9W8ED80_9FUNG|nr:DNA replication factor C complex subunit Rfc1 [Dimargaris verticillata]